MRIMAIDYGDARIGLAVSDPTGLICGEAWTMEEWNMERAARRICEEAEKRDVERFVLGLPKNMDGSEGFRAEACRQLAELISERINLPIDFEDERLTTVSAHNALNATNTRGKKRKAVVDAVSAVIILEDYLRKTKNQK